EQIAALAPVLLADGHAMPQLPQQAGPAAGRYPVAPPGAGGGWGGDCGVYCFVAQGRKPAHTRPRSRREKVRYVFRNSRGRVAQQPPRRTLCVPNHGSEYSLYGSAAKPGYGRKSLAVHSQTLPNICRQPKELSPAGKAATSTQPMARPSRLAGPAAGEVGQ